METLKIMRHCLAWLLIVAAACALAFTAGAVLVFVFHASQAAASVAFFGTLMLCTLWGAFD